MIRNRLLVCILLAAGLIALAAGLRFGANAGVVSPDLARRLVQVVIGLGLAGYANLMPKQLSAFKGSAEIEARSQRAVRVGAWTLTLAGLAHAALWAFAPLDLADTASMVVVAGGIAITAGYALWSFAACLAHRNQT